MSSPIKPWEGAGANSRTPVPPCCSTTTAPYGNRPNSLRGISSTSEAGQTSAAKPPPVPSRQQNSSYGSYGGYSGGMMGSYGGYGSSMYGGYGSGMYGGYGGSLYGGYGGYGGGYGTYNRFNSNQTMSPFVRQAEQSSQAAFQSVESIVQAFGSISMMLESTHFAMLNTFRAVLGAADHFSRMKSHVVNAIGAIAIIKTLKTLCKKVLYLIGLMKDSAVEDVWTEANSASDIAASSEQALKKNTKSWPIVMFFAVVLGVPWVIWKMLKAFISEEDDSRSWMKGTGDHIVARVEYDFIGEAEDELTVSAGSVIRVAPRDKQPRMRGWLLASVDGEQEGIVPANYVKILGLRRADNAQKSDETLSNGPQKTASLSHEQEAMNSLEKDDTLIEDFYTT